MKKSHHKDRGRNKARLYKEARPRLKVMPTKVHNTSRKKYGRRKKSTRELLEEMYEEYYDGGEE